MFTFTGLGYEKKAFLKADSPENDSLAAKLTELLGQAQVSYTSSNFNKEKFEFVLNFEEGKISAAFFKDIKPARFSRRTRRFLTCALPTRKSSLSILRQALRANKKNPLVRGSFFALI